MQNCHFKKGGNYGSFKNNFIRNFIYCWNTIANSYYYCNYGGRGIKIFDDWKKSFLKFYEWAITNGYKEGLTIDRINNDDDYKPNNCRWITRKQQNNNMRKNIFIEYNGKKQTISELADKYDLSRVALYYRLKRGWDIKKALTTPIKK